MSRPIHLFTIVVLTLMFVSTLVIANSCSADRPIINTDFKISCYKGQKIQIEIVCKTDEPWLNLPRDELKLSEDVAVTFENCSFPQELRLFNVTRSLGLMNVSDLLFENSKSNLTRENLRDFTLKTLEFNNNSFNELPSDILYDVDVQKLYIVDVGLQNIPENFFKFSMNLTYLEIIDNRLTKLKRSDFSNLNNLTGLLLFNNEIEEIESGTFNNLTNLLVLDISKNNLRTLTPELFKYLVKLERINLSENNFDNLPEDLLHVENSKLQLVRLSHNRGELTSLPNGFFKNLTNLNYVELRSDNFTSLPEDLFVGTSWLKTINISDNNLIDLPPKIFESTKNLWELQLSYNLLESLPEGVFQNANLERLYLNHNQLNNLSSNVLTGLTNLKVLQVSHNNLTQIDGDACKEHFKRLEFVDLSYNQLTFVNNLPNSNSFSSLLDCIELKQLNLSYNKIFDLFLDWNFDTHLKDLNLEGNNITYISAIDLNILHTNAKLNLQKNQISTINLEDLEESFKEYQKNNGDNKENKKAIVQLQNNPLNCDCNLLDFFRYIEQKMTDDIRNYIMLEVDNLKCATPPQFANRSITEITSEDLKCLVKSSNIKDSCSEICTCWDYPGRQVLSVDCSNRNFTKVPEFIENAHNRSIELNLSGNMLQETPSLNHSYLLNVTVLNLSENNISLVSLSVFSNSLQKLELHNNEISRLNSQVVNYLSDNTILNNLTLHGNKWICDCEARNFLSVVQKKLTTFGLHDVMCYGSNRRLSTMTANELCEDRAAMYITLCLLLAFSCLVVGGTVALYFIYQKEIKVWLYSKHLCLWFVTEDELDKDKKYDAFISYSHKDEDFVDKEIVSKLEEGTNPYKLCLHYRDWLAGEWIPQQIARSVSDSRRTIVVLSPNFLESIWGRMEFRTAHSQALSEGRARVIVILYGDIGNTDDLDPELKAYLSMNTYVKWGDPWFWDKLKYALPHRYGSPRRRTRTARIIENHLAQMSVNNHQNGAKPEAIPMPKITINDSDKLLDSGTEDNRSVASC